MADAAFASVSGAQDELADVPDEVANRTVAEDGADVVILAGAPLAGLADEKLEEKGLAALALSVVLPVIGAIFPFIETGEAQGVNCAALMKAAEDAGGVSQGTPSTKH